jgi:serine phosphatase RsbU (regulator of sigma subunit)
MLPDQSLIDLSVFSLFTALPHSELAALEEIAQRCHYPAGQILFNEGELSASFLMIHSGEVEIFKSMDQMGDRILAVRGAGDYLGEMSLFLPDQVRSASARARGDACTLEFPRSAFEALLKRQPALAFLLVQEINRRFRSSEDLSNQDLRLKNQRLEQALEELKAAQTQIIAKEKLEHELAVARKIQRNLLPKEIPNLPGWRLTAEWQPARSVSGDFYDFLLLPEGNLLIVVGDVTGKGVPAALVMATTCSVLRTAVNSFGAMGQIVTPGMILAHVNDLLCREMPEYMFVTCLFAVLNPHTGRLCLANAGHPPPYRYTGQELIELRATGMPLGLLPGQEYIEIETILQPCDGVLLFSDGLVEAHHPSGEMFSFGRLCELLTRITPQPGIDGETLIADLLQALHDFTGPSWEQEDDLTFVTLEYLPNAPARSGDTLPPG